MPGSALRQKGHGSPGCPGRGALGLLRRGSTDGSGAGLPGALSVPLQFLIHLTITPYKFLFVRKAVSKRLQFVTGL